MVTVSCGSGAGLTMSLLGAKVAVVSLGMSCQSSYQIDLHAKLIAQLVGDPTANVSGFPFDNIICPPPSAVRMLRADRFYPEAMNELVLSNPESGGHWREMEGVHYWHAFLPVRSGILRRKKLDAPKSFHVLTEKYAHMASKFRRLSRVPRLIFVISNSQNNLDMVARVTGNVDLVLDSGMIDALADQTDAYFGRNCEYIVATYPDRFAGLSGRGNIFVHKLSPDESEWGGDEVQWAELFRKALPPKFDLLSN